MTEKLHVLGTGNALVTRCYNTCFYLEWPEGGLLVDCGGGNGILQQMEDAGLGVESVHHLFLTHAHTDRPSAGGRVAGAHGRHRHAQGQL